MTDLETRIALTPETRDKLRARKRGTDRYEDVVRRLLRDEENA